MLERKDNSEQWRKSALWSPRGRSTWGRSSQGSHVQLVQDLVGQKIVDPGPPRLDLPHVDLPLGLQRSLFRHCSMLSFLSPVPRDRGQASGEQIDDGAEPRREHFEFGRVGSNRCVSHRLDFTLASSCPLSLQSSHVTGVIIWRASEMASAAWPTPSAVATGSLELSKARHSNLACGPEGHVAG